MRGSRQLAPLGLLFVLTLACNSPVPFLRATAPHPDPSPPASLSPPPSITPLPSPTPTPPPGARVALGDRALFYGDWDAALAEFETALNNSPDPDVRFAALLGKGKTYFLKGEYDEAQSVLQDLLEEEIDFSLRAETFFHLGQVYSALGEYQKAANAYASYLELRPGVIESYIQELRGDALAAAGDFPGAIAAYQSALASSRLGDDLDVAVKLARAYHASGDLATAIVAYKDIYMRTSNNYTRAQMDWLLGQAYIESGDVEAAFSAYQDAVDNYPLAYDSYLALVELVNADIPVNELDRGLVDYFAGQYGVAISAFERYLQGEPEEPDTALYYMGLAQNSLGEYQGAIQTWESLLQKYPESDFAEKALEQIANTQWFYQGNFRLAVRTLVDFVDANPIHPRAADLLFQAASIAERGDRLEQAARLWVRLADDYPSAEQASRALFLAGITRYRLANYPAAHELFQRMLVHSLDPEARSAAYLWMGKSLQMQGEAEAARASFQQAAQLDPTGYYSERARDILEERAPFSPPLEYDLTFDLNEERKEAEDWMRTVFDLPSEIDLASPGPLAEDARFQRGNELWRLGLYEQARAEFEDLRRSVESDPANSYRLANHLLELGLYRPAIFAARQVLTLAGMDDASSLRAPEFFNHVRFGPYYRELVVQASQEYNFHPLLLFSIMRQESLFEGFIRSSAGARGLMQILPNTGEEIADRSDWPPNFSPADLYRPMVSIKLGTAYLERQRGFMGGDLYGMLAAYNGGPGNAATWRALVPPDADLFLEVIRLEETRNYIKGVYEIFTIYRMIYDRTP